jgi:hypothetical protein
MNPIIVVAQLLLYGFAWLCGAAAMTAAVFLGYMVLAILGLDLGEPKILVTYVVNLVIFAVVAVLVSIVQAMPPKESTTTTASSGGGFSLPYYPERERKERADSTKDDRRDLQRQIEELREDGRRRDKEARKAESQRSDELRRQKDLESRRETEARRKAEEENRQARERSRKLSRGYSVYYTTGGNAKSKSGLSTTLTEAIITADQVAKRPSVKSVIVTDPSGNTVYTA